ncbi:hypothetical protein [Levilactobacillus suantsaii]|uniref:hypothetical protein n=1 Tax=Levilactobacillus suantsaii TaxID=2292255 RepID=UPI002D80D6F4|nr:hypothetical protein [Levilactobacillus suantsaii]
MTNRSAVSYSSYSTLTVAALSGATAGKGCTKSVGMKVKVTWSPPVTSWFIER